MKKSIKQYIIATMLLCTLLINATIPVAAAGETGSISSKEEVVYSILNTDGAIKDIYIVNILNVTKGGIVSDYGKYESVKNLTNTNDINYSNGKVDIQANKGQFYYQGNLKNCPLPWDFSITYKLDGKKISGEKLAGKDGHLEINITTKQNEEVNPVFYENYLLQISLTLSSDNCKNIIADGATLANAGDDKMISYTVMPEKDGDMMISTDVTDFEMTGISFAAMPFSMDMELPDTSKMTEDMTELTDAIKELNNGVQELEDGAIKLKDGTIELKDGFDEFYEGIVELNDGAEELKKGAAELNHAGFELREGSTQYKEGLNALSASSADIINGSAAFLTALQSTPGLEALAAQYELMHQGLAQYTGGVDAMAAGYGDIKKGIVGYTGGVTELYKGLEEFVIEGTNTLVIETPKFGNGIDELVDGVGEFADGVGDLAEGTQEMHDETKDMPDKIQESIDEMMEDYETSDFTLASFVSENNKNVESVQFIITSENIKTEEETNEPDKQEEKKETFVTRFMNLFKKKED